ncbi:PTS sugar transporter subunit IIA [Clostridium intestinale]|uniref:PTS system mannose/fructose/sorbose family transporter subunit IIA n=1 Tax=Clostridium intestinale URNW TaxID=1294142 RepID=U2Q6K0_9CLOT|nr:mannose/fructose/sorbose PTS transporter subunit IIA [Clostridium intestinale]ERK31789.1 PTS system mannose/fructose/sorbose family transporter subunit IIA [Clostridium intestinale URNW]
MVAIIVGTHGDFSREIVKSSEMIFGKQENIQYVTFNPGESADDLINKYESIMRELDYEDGLLFMVDLFGGSPYNAASRVAVKEAHIDIVTGVNLPMLLEVFAVRDSISVEELVKVAETAGNMGIKSFKSNFVNIEEEL